MCGICSQMSQKYSGDIKQSQASMLLFPIEQSRISDR